MVQTSALVGGSFLVHGSDFDKKSRTPNIFWQVEVSSSPANKNKQKRRTVQGVSCTRAGKRTSTK